MKGKSQKRQPVGIPLKHVWEKENPEPTVKQLAQRYDDVCDAIARCRSAGYAVPWVWLDEIGVLCYTHRRRSQQYLID